MDLTGQVLGTAVPQDLILTRPAAPLIWRAYRAGFSARSEPTAFPRHPGVLLLLLAIVYAVALIVERLEPRWIMPASEMLQGQTTKTAAQADYERWLRWLLRASVGSTEAAKDVVARVGGVRPTRASSWLAYRSSGRNKHARIR
jgi:hypothetical protein